MEEVGVPKARKLEPRIYTIVQIPLKTRVVPVFRLFQKQRYAKRLVERVRREEVSARVLYSLLALALVSTSLSLDFYGICYVCSLKRSKRTTLKRNILNRCEQRGLLKRKVRCTMETYHVHRDPSEAPTLEREYREYKPEEAKRIKKRREHPGRDLAVLFEDSRALIPESWKIHFKLTMKRRDGYQFERQRIVPTMTALLTLGGTCLQCRAVSEWAQSSIERICERLRHVMSAYRVEAKYMARLERLAAAATRPDSSHAAALVGFALCDLTRESSYDMEP